MLKSLAGVVSRYLFLALTVSLFVANFSSDTSLKQTNNTNYSAPHSVLLHTLQSKYATVRSLRIEQHDSHPVGLHPAVERASIPPNYAEVSRFTPSGRSKPGTAKVGWQARAPPFSAMPVKF